VALRAYKLALSPLFFGCCRFTPSCSDYMAGAIRVHGIFRGTSLGVRRLLRCHPFGGHGFDPVPSRRA
jgi:putative membrane protein insertion efficiency factor